MAFNKIYIRQRTFLHFSVQTRRSRSRNNCLLSVELRIQYALAILKLREKVKNVLLELPVMKRQLQFEQRLLKKQVQ